MADPEATVHSRAKRVNQDDLREDLDQQNPREESMRMLDKGSTTVFERPRTRTRAWGVLLFYIPLLIIPWAMTCGMTFRPLTAASYNDQAGGLTSRDFRVNEGWQVAINILNAIAALLTIPVTSLLLAEGTVIWMQRREKPGPAVPLAHFYDLADRAWTDTFVVAREVFRKHQRDGDLAGRNWFLLGSAALVAFCSVILPLQQVLVRTETIQVVTCRDVPYHPHGGIGLKCGFSAFAEIAEDAQPGVMQAVPLWNVKEQVSSRIALDTSTQRQALLWSGRDSVDVEGGWYPTTANVENAQILTHYGANNENIPWWISAVSNGTTTGVLRQHALGLNFSIGCENIPADQFPTTCAGGFPFKGEFPWTHNYSNVDNYLLAVCVPGNYKVSPWSLSRDAITIEENIYLGMLPRNGSFSSRFNNPFVTHCTVNTTRGYFELGNYFNDFLPQPMLATFPRADEVSKFNDYESVSTSHSPSDYLKVPYLGPVDHANITDYEEWLSYAGRDPSELGDRLTPPDMPEGYSYGARTLQNDSSIGTMYVPGMYMKAPGPLASSAVALFGNESYFGTSKRASAANDSATTVELCHNSRVPFASIDRDEFPISFRSQMCSRAELASDIDYAYSITYDLTQWFHAFSDPEAARRAFGVSTYYAAEALLTQSTNLQGGQRVIYASDGHTTTKPTMARASMIVLTLMLGVEVIALLTLAWYNTSTPTWTRTLKSLSVAQLANAMERRILPPAGSTDEAALKLLYQLDGRVGIEHSGSADGEPAREKLVHGGSGGLSRTKPRHR